jgi:hypothetical protein
MALEFLKRREFLRRRRGKMSNTDLMADIGHAENLQRRASVNAVKSGLRDLKRN